MVCGQTLKWTDKFPHIAPVTGATDTPVGIAATKTNVYVAGDVMASHGRLLAVAQYEIPEQSGGVATLRSSLYYSNSAMSAGEPIVADAMVICKVEGTSNPEIVEGARIFIASHSPDVNGKQRAMVTSFITNDNGSGPHQDYGKLELSWSRYFEDLDPGQGDQIPVAIAVASQAPNPVVAVAIKTYNVTAGWNMRLVALRIVDGKMRLNQSYASAGAGDDIPVGVVVGGGRAFIGGTTWNAPGLIGPRMVVAGWDYMTGAQLSGSPLVVSNGNVLEAIATCMSGSSRPTETKPTAVGQLFAMAGYSFPPINSLILNQDIVTATFEFNTATQQLALVGHNRWDRVIPVGDPQISEDKPVAIALAEEFTQNEVPQGPVIAVTGTSRVDGEPTKIVTLQYQAISIDQPRQWWAIHTDLTGTFGDAFPTSIMYDIDDSSVDGFTHTYVSGAIIGPSGNWEFINLKYVSKCALGYPCGNDTNPPRGVDPSWVQGPPTWPISGFTNAGNDVAVSTSARNVFVSPGVSRRWFFTVGPSYRGTTGIDWETLGYCEEGCGQ